MCSAANLLSAINGRGRRWPCKTAQTLYWNCLPYFRAAARNFCRRRSAAFSSDRNYELPRFRRGNRGNTNACSCRQLHQHSSGRTARDYKKRRVLRRSPVHTFAKCRLYFCRSGSKRYFGTGILPLPAKYAPEIAPLVIRRCGAGYNSSDISAEYASASGIRTEYAAAGLSGRILNQIPKCSHKLLETLHSLNLLGWNTAKLDALVLYKLCMLTEQQIAAACECTEGLEHRLKAAAACPDMQIVVSRVSSKRYTKSRIRRLLMQLLLGNDKTIFTEAKPQYLRVLAFNSRGRSLLAQMRKTASLPVITKIGRNFKNCLTGDTEKDELIIRQLQMDINAANLLALLQNRSQNYCQTYNSDFLMQPFQQA